MTRVVTALAVAAAVRAMSGAAPVASHTDSAAGVELDAVVTDRHGQPVAGLRAEDFEVVEDGVRVTLVESREVSDAADGQHHRSMVLLLDDLMVPAIGTTVVQQIARFFVGHADRNDAVSVVRLAHLEDDAIAPRLIAWARIDGYLPVAVVPSAEQATNDALNVVARIASELDPSPPGRTAVICIGTATVCNPYVPRPRYSAFWRPWRAAIRLAARANVALYFVDPAGANSSPDFADGLADQTGGLAFVRTNNFGHAADTIWSEISHYYLLRYRPSSDSKPLHSIRVTVARRGVHVRSRTVRTE